MLKKLLYISCLLSLLGICSIVNAQTSIRNFYLQQYQKSIKVNFVITSRQYCTGYEIQRSTDTIEFVSIYNYPVFCSESREPISVVYYDEQPVKNTISFYRIYVPPSTLSSIQAITYRESPDLGYILYSNPVDQIFKMKVNSPFATTELYNVTGRKLFDFLADAEGMINENIQLLPNGIYYFLIKTKDNLMVRGKFVKAN